MKTVGKYSQVPQKTSQGRQQTSQLFFSPRYIAHSSQLRASELVAFAHLGVSNKWWYPKMDGENNGKPY